MNTVLMNCQLLKQNLKLFFNNFADKRETFSQGNNTSRETENTGSSEIHQSKNVANNSQVFTPESTTGTSAVTQAVIASSSFSLSSTKSTTASTTNLSGQVHPHISSNPALSTASSDIVTTTSNLENRVLTLSASPSNDPGLISPQKNLEPSSSSSVLQRKKQSISTLSRQNSPPRERHAVHSGSRHSLEGEDCPAHFEKSANAPSLLPETSGFVRTASRGFPVELKRGRGRPRKDGLNPLQRRPA